MDLLKHYLQSHKYEKIVFVGDGSNDLCLSLYLSSHDVVFPREGYKLVSLLDQNCVQQACTDSGVPVGGIWLVPVDWELVVALPL